MEFRNIIFLLAVMALANTSCKEIKDKDANVSKGKSIVIQKQCMDGIMKQDDSLGTIRNHFCETASLSETIMQYTTSLKDLDFSDCPDIFKSAFQRHIEAWLLMMPVTNQHGELRGELHTLFDKIAVSKDSTQFKIKLKRIWDTWADIEQTIKEN